MSEQNKRVLLTDTREPQARAAADYLRGQGYEVIGNDPDTGVKLSDEAALTAWAETLPELCGVIHPAPPRILARTEEATETQWLEAREDGIVAAWAVTKVFCGRMKRQGCGTMIYLGSVHAEKPVGGGFLFSLGCGATEMLCREASQDYAQFGVKCFYVQRGPMREDLYCQSNLSNYYYGLDVRYPSRETPGDGYLNGLLAFLLTDASWPLNGADLRADGGASMYYGHRYKLEGREYVEHKPH